MKLLGVLLFAIVFLTLNSAHSEDLKKPSKIDEPRIPDKTKENLGTTDSYKNPPTSKHKETHIISDIEKKTECVKPTDDTPIEKIVFTPLDPLEFLDGKKKTSYWSPKSNEQIDITFQLQEVNKNSQDVIKQVLNKPVRIECSIPSWENGKCTLSTGKTIIDVSVGFGRGSSRQAFITRVKSALVNSHLFEACTSLVDGHEISNEPSKKQNRKNNSRGLASEEIP